VADESGSIVTGTDDIVPNSDMFEDREILP
jgi:hypothetical protein